MLPPFLNPARERATAAPLSDSAEGDGGHARAGKWPVSEYGRKCRRLPLREVPVLLWQRGARAKSVRAHLPFKSSTECRFQRRVLRRFRGARAAAAPASGADGGSAGRRGLFA